jgi:hypothetical protein
MIIHVYIWGLVCLAMGEINPGMFSGILHMEFSCSM